MSTMACQNTSNVTVYWAYAQAYTKGKKQIPALLPMPTYKWCVLNEMNETYLVILLYSI